MTGRILILGLALAMAAGAALAAQGVHVAAPAGYCIDREASAGHGLVLMGRCEGDSERPPAILTAVVGPSGSGMDVRARGQELAAFFSSTEGRAALSRSGNARRVELLEARGRGEAFLLRLRDTSPGHHGQTEGWRAVLSLNGRLVTLTATGTGAAPLSRENGKRLIGAFVDAMEAANPRGRQAGN
ncbi:cation transport ATPase [Rhodobacter sp. CZR27]|uniref:cation transport ATPase n=1 Tax=Rhodobacter sp. CZR27 TaxID=2033869 RepID=UPI001E4D795B|nr:cation transport ATPase [Rhodobacter sp. CZR27]